MPRVQHVIGQAAFDTSLSKAGSQLVVVDISATWCGPCKQLRPIMENLVKKDYDGKVIYYYIDIEKFPEIGDMLSVRLYLLNIFESYI